MNLPAPKTFAASVVEKMVREAVTAEREECAKIADGFRDMWREEDSGGSAAAYGIALAIRNRSSSDPPSVVRSAYGMDLRTPERGGDATTGSGAARPRGAPPSNEGNAT